MATLEIVISVAKRFTSLGKATELAGYKRLDFIDKLRFEGEPIFHYDESYLTEMYSSISQFEKKAIK